MSQQTIARQTPKKASNNKKPPLRDAKPLTTFRATLPALYVNRDGDLICFVCVGSCRVDQRLLSVFLSSSSSSLLVNIMLKFVFRNSFE
jgi:hypothetical protein